ncbi:MAG: choice-of-anchor D domain-containing protein [Saprospiraceae bacterium]|nr:choice-of-anchor D domain-containing protein [Saprospiraceae bacterium]
MHHKLFCCFLLITGLLQGQNTLIPDANFEQRLIDMNYDEAPIDGMVVTDSINSIAQLWIPNSSILDLTGIEDFLSLEILDITGNGIVSLDLGNNLSLRELYAETNPISSINLLNNTALEIARLGNMQLTSLDVSNCTSLLDLRCDSNNLTIIDVSNNVLLNSFNCSENLLCNLDLSTNSALVSLRCNNNQLRVIDVKNANNNLLSTFVANSNSASLCIQVDDEAAANGNSGVYASWQTDPGINYSENCSADNEIDITGLGVSIQNGDDSPDTLDDTDFGIVSFGSFLDHEFTIENMGESDLNLTGSPLITITNSSDFTIVANPNPNIAPMGTTTFTVRYEPSQAGTINTGILSISNDDCDEDPYVFYVRGESSTTLSLPQYYSEANIQVYPNPTQDISFIKYRGLDPISSIAIFDINGKAIKMNYGNLSEEIIELDLRSLKGIYFLVITTRHNQLVRKLVII